MNQFLTSSNFTKNKKKNTKQPKKLHHSIFFFGGATLLLWPLLFFKKGTFILALNQLHSPSLDLFFSYITYLGDGLIFLPLLTIFLFIRFYHTLLLFVMGVGNALLSALLKRGIFGAVPRPKRHFAEIIDQVYLIPWVDVHSSWSFPSGHTATAFMIAVFFSLFFNKKGLSILFLAYAILVGVSRMYLFQHFFIDVFAGATVGSLSAYAIYYWFESKNYKNTSLLNRRLKITTTTTHFVHGQQVG